MKRISLFLKKEQIEKLKKNYEKYGIKMAEQIRRAIDSYLTK